MSELTMFKLSEKRPAFLSFYDGDAEVFVIEPGGKLRAGAGLSDEEATRRLFAVMVEAWPALMRDLAQAEPAP
jgi:hypothetical protein